MYESVVGYRYQPYCAGNRLALGQGYFNFSELDQDLLRLCLFLGISASLQFIQYLIFQLDTFEGVRSLGLEGSRPR